MQYRGESLRLGRIEVLNKGALKLYGILLVSGLLSIGMRRFFVLEGWAGGVLGVAIFLVLAVALIIVASWFETRGS